MASPRGDPDELVTIASYGRSAMIMPPFLLGSETNRAVEADSTDNVVVGVCFFCTIFTRAFVRLGVPRSTCTIRPRLLTLGAPHKAGGQLPDAVDHGKRSSSVSQQDRLDTFVRQRN
jgi:hypothetical protein